MIRGSWYKVLEKSLHDLDRKQTNKLRNFQIFAGHDSGMRPMAM